MVKQTWRSSACRFAYVLLLCLATVACAANSGVVMHSFSFDARKDSPDVEILDYRYGDSKQPSARAPDWAIKQNQAPQWTNITSEMLRPDSLYVRWRVKSTGEIHEDTVDLRSRLPADIKDHRVYFIARGRQLYIYLITPERRAPESAPKGPSMYQHLKSITIYPDAGKQ